MMGYVAFYGLGPLVAFTDGADRGLSFFLFRSVGNTGDYGRGIPWMVCRRER